MAEAISNVAIITKAGSPEAQKAAKRITELFRPQKTTVYATSPLTIDGARSIETEQLKNLVLDMVIAVGGDGTTLRAFRYIPHESPLLSVNVGGNRGVLSETGIESMDDSIHAVLRGQFFYERRIRLCGSTRNTNFPPALNDIILIRQNPIRTPKVTLKIMDDVLQQRMDGIIVSTPTGSTGHSYSIGGPVVYEKLDSLLLSPIASMNRMPQIVLPPVEIEISISHDTCLIVDGQEVFHVSPSESVKISRYPYDAQFIRIRHRGMRQIAKLGF
jgi:NAD+ kinase